MARQSIIIVNASNVISDKDVSGWIEPMQKYIDNMVCPAWLGETIVPVELLFGTISDIPKLPKDAWPIFLNRHSSDPGAAGWHTQEGHAIYGRVFAGDCILYGMSITVDLTHEIVETMGDPDASKTYEFSPGKFAAVELCDAVEADNQAITVDGIQMSNFVFPSYFSEGVPMVKYDYQGILRGPCPALTKGGYMEINAAGKWGSLQMDRSDGLMGRRAHMNGWRRRLRRQSESLLQSASQ